MTQASEAEMTAQHFRINPVPKPRMTRSDRWQQRPVVVRYWAFKDCLQRAANETGFALGEAFEVTFYLPMPASWSKAKKARMAGKPHQVRPDIDNCVKSTLDSLLPDDDSAIWYISARKVWALEGAIAIENITVGDMR